jgi:hypothetical protein
MKKISLKDVENLSLDKDSKRRIIDTKQNLAMQTVLQTLSEAINSNSMTTAEIRKVIESDALAFQKVSKAIEMIGSNLNKINNKVQQVEVINQPSPDAQPKTISEWEFTVKRDSFGKIVKVNAKGN